MIIVEGCDKTGKTSMAAALRDELGWPVVKCSQPHGDAVSEYWEVLTNHAEPFVADRFHLGEFVYGPLYRNTYPDVGRMRRLEDELIRRGALLVLMWDRPAAIADRFFEYGESFVRVDHVPRIVSDFDAAWGKSRVAKVRLYWGESREEHDDAVDYVVGLLR